jgi:glycosyltransferase involved in cell wall biosynthesis
MVSILFFTHNQAVALARSLAPLVHDAVEGHIAEVIIVDDSSTDTTAAIADASGCTLAKTGERPLRAVMKEARADWFVVLEPGARLKEGWHEEVMDHIMRAEAAAATFRRERTGNWLSRIFRPVTERRGPLASGLVISKAQALANLSANAKSGEDLVRGLALRVLDAEIEMAPTKAP